MVLGLSVIEADSLNTSHIRDMLPSVSGVYFGLTGPCGFDANGDRLVFQTGLYAYGYDPSPRWMLIGYYHSPENTVIWDESYID